MLFTVWPKNLFPWRLGIINNLSTNWNVWPRHDVFCLFKSQATPSSSAQLKIPIFHLSYFWIYWTTFNSALSFRSSINPFAASFLKLWLRWIDEGGMLGVFFFFGQVHKPWITVCFFVLFQRSFPLSVRRRLMHNWSISRPLNDSVLNTCSNKNWSRCIQVDWKNHFLSHSLIR